MHTVCIDGAVALAAAKAADSSACFVVIGKYHATECQLVKYDYADTQCWEKLELMRTVQPDAIPIGFLLRGYGMDPKQIKLPKFGNHLVLFEFDKGTKELHYGAYKWVDGNWLKCSLRIVSDAATQIAIDESAGIDRKFALQQLLARIRAVRNREDMLDKYAQLKKIPFLNEIKNDKIPQAEDSYLILKEFASKHI